MYEVQKRLAAQGTKMLEMLIAQAIWIQSLPQLRLGDLADELLLRKWRVVVAPLPRHSRQDLTSCALYSREAPYADSPQKSAIGATFQDWCIRPGDPAFVEPD